MTPTAAAILEGMPEPKDLHRAEHDGMTFVSAGSAVLAWYPSGDAGMRNVTVAVLRQLGFGGQAVAAVMGLTENYVATLHNRASTADPALTKVMPSCSARCRSFGSG